MKKLLFIIFIVAALPGMAQDGSISVELIPPPPGEFNLSTFNNAIIITNTSAQNFLVKYYGLISEKNDGIIFEGNTNGIQLPPGVTFLNEDNIGSLTMTYNPQYYESIIRTGNAPAGLYTFCLSVVNAETEQTLAKNCIQFEVEKPLPPELLYPANGIVLEEEIPSFVWTPPTPFPAKQEVSYRFIIAEIYDKQTSYEAMISNPWYLEENIQETTVTFPVGAREMVPGDTYCWMVQSVEQNGNPIGHNEGRSEIFTFIYQQQEKEPLSAPRPAKENNTISAQIYPITPLANCVGEVTEHINQRNVTFTWSAAGEFSEFCVVLSENPCGKFPKSPPSRPGPPPTIPTSPPGTPPGTPPSTPVTPVTPTGPVIDAPGRDSGAKPVTTEGGTTTYPPDDAKPVPADDTLPWDDEDEQDLPPLPPGWAWGEAGPYWTGEYPPEPPALPPGWDWGPLRPVWVGEGTPPPRKVLGRSEMIPAEPTGIVGDVATYNLTMDLSNMVEPGAAFIYQIYGTSPLDNGTFQGVLSESQCLRYLPIGEDGTIPPELDCPEVGCRVDYEMTLRSFDISAGPTGNVRTLPDDPLPLTVLSNDLHCLIEKCFCNAGEYTKILTLRANVRYEWQIISGEGGFIKLNDGSESKKETGQDVLFNPPEIADTVNQKTIVIEVKAYHNDNTKAPDHKPISATLTLNLKREIKDKGEWKSNPHEFTDPGKIEDRYVYDITIKKDDAYFNDCPEPKQDECFPAYTWQKDTDIDGDISLIPKEVCSGDHVRLEATGSDQDKLKLICVPTGQICTIPDTKTLTFNDFLEYKWSATKGTFIFGETGKEVVWQAPDEEGEVTITLTIKDVGGQYDDKDKEIKKTFRVNKLGIDLVKLDKYWLPDVIYSPLPKEVKPTIYVCKNGKWEENGRKKIIYAKFKNLSREPGICMNFPPPPANISSDILLNRNPDIFFDEKKNEKDWILMKDTSTTFKYPTQVLFPDDNPAHDHHYLMAVSQKKSYSLMPSIRVQDFGAYGNIEAIANHCKMIPPREMNDKPCKTEKSCCTGSNSIKLPRDDNNNDIADGARQDENGAPATQDKDNSPSYSSFLGDGLTNYQEYRGFVYTIGASQRSYYRTPTDMRNLFIRNSDNLPIDYFRKSYLSIFEVNDSALWQFSDMELKLFSSSPAIQNGHTNIHPMEINYNRCRHERHCVKTSEKDDWGEQHGLWLAVDENMSGIYGMCEADSSLLETSGFFVVPKIVYRVAISKSSVESKTAGNPPVIIANSLNKTVAHELGHGVNVRHHGDLSRHFFAPNAKRAVKSGNSYRFFDKDGNVIEPLECFARNGQTSGNASCVMTYDNWDGWYNKAEKFLFKDVNRNGVYNKGIDTLYTVRYGSVDYTVFIDPIHKHALPQTVGNTFCVDKKPTNWNLAPSKGGSPTLPPGKENNLDNPANTNGCARQIRVKDWSINP